MMSDTVAGSAGVSSFYVWLGLDVKPEGIPESLKRIDQWVLWKAETDNDKNRIEKVPYQPNDKKASSTDPKTWIDFETALLTLEEDGSAFSGIGFVVTEDNGIVLLDFDHVRDGATGKIKPEIMGAVQYLDTYAEVSPSGTGVRVIGYGSFDGTIEGKTLQGWKTRRYVTITGHQIPGTPNHLKPIDPVRLQETRTYFADQPRAKHNGQAQGPLLDQAQCLEIRQALGYLDPDETYDQWLTVGMALHDTGAPNAFGLWNEWSQGGPKYDSKTIRSKWASFGNTSNSIALGTLFKLAQDAGWVNTASNAAQAAKVFTPVEAPSAPLYAPTKLNEFPAYLIDQAPGVIGSLTQWGLRTAQKPQPQLALQAAMATATAAMARRYRTNLNNWPALWFLGIALSASGKEHGKTMIEEALSASGLGHLVAGAGYTSPGAVFSTLLDKPSHVVIVDEYGKLVESAQAKGNQVKADAITMLMEVFGRVHGTVRPANYSFMALSKEQRQSLSSRVIHKPSITMLAMTTPSTFYASLTRQWIADGFLGRLFVTESPLSRMPSLYPDHEPVPETCANWLRVASLQEGSEQPGNLAQLDMASDMEPNPILLRFSSEAKRAIRAFERDIIERTNEADRDGLDALYGRTVEKAMRLSMAVSLAEDPSTRTISASHIQYAIEYAAACDMALVEAVRWNVADSDFGRTKNRCLEIIRAAGAKGVTPRELARRCSAFNALKPREQSEVLDALSGHRHAELQTIQTLGGRGKKRVAWVALAEEGDEDEE